MDTDSWHIIRVAPGKEREVSLAAHGFACYHPTHYVKRFNRRFRVWRSVQQALLPGYLFINTLDLRPFLNFPQPHVFGPLRNGDRSFATIRAGDVEALRVHERSTFERDLPHLFRERDAVKVREGHAFAGLKSAIERLEGLTGIVLKATVFGAEREIYFEAEALEAA